MSWSVAGSMNIFSTINNAQNPRSSLHKLSPAAIPKTPNKQELTIVQIFRCVQNKAVFSFRSWRRMCCASKWNSRRDDELAQPIAVDAKKTTEMHGRRKCWEKSKFQKIASSSCFQFATINQLVGISWMALGWRLSGMRFLRFNFKWLFIRCPAVVWKMRKMRKKRIKKWIYQIGQTSKIAPQQALLHR